MKNRKSEVLPFQITSSSENVVLLLCAFQDIHRFFFTQKKVVNRNKLSGEYPNMQDTCVINTQESDRSSLYMEKNPMT